MRTQTIIGRREALRLGGGALLASAAVPTMGWASVLGATEPRRAMLHNLHTGDRFNEVYFENGRYVPGALAEAMRVLRDWRTGEEHVMEPGLFDALHAISVKLDSRTPFQIISGYRSSKTNAALHAKSSGVASNSQHTLGKAVDVRLQGVDLRNLHKAALATAAGGVGFYPKSDFVHVDVGRVRQWVGV
ncbi:MAG: YcbK family protein [Phenylobacterium sp.]